jgi:hypothetical protein
MTCIEFVDGANSIASGFGSKFRPADNPSEEPNASLPDRAFAKEFRNIEIHKIGMMENNRLDGALHLVALVTVGGDDVHDFPGNTMLVGQRDAGKWMPDLLAKRALNDPAGSILVELQRLAHVGQKRTGNEKISLDWDIATEGTLEHIRDRDTLPCAGVKMLDERHLDVAGQERKLDRAQFVEAPAFPAAAGRDGLVPHGRHLFTQ